MEFLTVFLLYREKYALADRNVEIPKARDDIIIFNAE